MKANLLAAIVLAAAAANPATVEPTLHSLYQRPLQAQPGAAGQTCAVLDAETFAHAAADLADIRLARISPGQTAAAVEEQPYIIRESESTARPPRNLPLLNLGSRSGQTTFDAAMPDGGYRDVSLAVNAENFIASVTVTGSQQQTGPATRLGAFTIFDLTTQKLGRSTVLHLPPSDFRFLHFAIAGPIKPDQVSGLEAGAASAGELPYAPVAQTSEVTQKNRLTVVQFRVPAHVPVDRITFSIGAGAQNFSRDVSIRAASASPPQQMDEEPLETLLANGRLLRVHGVHDGHRIDEENLTIAVRPDASGPTGQLWTIDIDNGDDPPLPVESVRLEMAERQICFDATSGTQYALFYGNPSLAAPRYDYATLFTPEKHPLPAALAPEQKNLHYQPPPDRRPLTERYPFLLWVGLLLVVAVLGLVALKTAQDSKPPAP